MNTTSTDTHSSKKPGLQNDFEKMWGPGAKGPTDGNADANLLPPIEILRCTKCSQASLEKITNHEVKCSSCKQSYPIYLGVLSMLTKARDTDTLVKFEQQWKEWGADDVIFGKTIKEFEDRIVKEFKNPNLDRSWFKGKRCLDAGCGHGMATEALANFGGEAIGLELGAGVFRAAKRLAGTGAKLVQGDILDIPFKDNSFDYVFSNGVIHHTRDTRFAFKQLARLVKPGVSLDIWLYPKKGFVWETTMGLGRAVTTKLPAPVMARLSYALVPLLYVVPTWSRTHPRTHTKKQCAQVIYDWLSPKYQTHHTFEEVKQWYEEEGFTNIGQIPTTPLAMYGVKRA